MIDLIWKYSTIQKMYTSKYLFFSEDELTGVEILIATCNGFLSTTKKQNQNKRKKWLQLMSPKPLIPDKKEASCVSPLHSARTLSFPGHLAFGTIHILDSYMFNLNILASSAP